MAESEPLHERIGAFCLHLLYIALFTIVLSSISSEHGWEPAQVAATEMVVGIAFLYIGWQLFESLAEWAFDHDLNLVGKAFAVGGLFLVAATAYDFSVSIPTYGRLFVVVGALMAFSLLLKGANSNGYLDGLVARLCGNSEVMN